MKTFKGEPIHLVGTPVKLGDIAPDFKAVNVQLETVHLSSFQEEYLVLSVVPSIDTAVCDMQTRTLHQELSNMSNLKVITISVDLPFAQSKWCGQSGFDHVVTLSDYLYHDFGLKYGVLIEELKLLSRSVFVLNKKRQIIYTDFVLEQSQHLNFDQLLQFIKQLPNG